MEIAGSSLAPQSPFLATLAAVAAFLRATQKPAAVIGGVAVIARGFARSTIDIDATVAASTEEVDWLIQVAALQSLIPRIENASAFAHENLVLLLEHRQHRVPVDVNLAQQPFEVEAAALCEMVDFAGVAIPVVSLTALLIHKMIAGRPRDLHDVKALLSANAFYDVERVKRTLTEFDSILAADSCQQFEALVNALAINSRG